MSVYYEGYLPNEVKPLPFSTVKVIVIKLLWYDGISYTIIPHTCIVTLPYYAGSWVSKITGAKAESIHVLMWVEPQRQTFVIYLQCEKYTPI